LGENEIKFISAQPGAAADVAFGLVSSLVCSLAAVEVY
jgi:hypothetical protein